MVVARLRSGRCDRWTRAVQSKRAFFIGLLGQSHPGSTRRIRDYSYLSHVHLLSRLVRSLGSSCARRIQSEPNQFSAYHRVCRIRIASVSEWVESKTVDGKASYLWLPRSRISFQEKYYEVYRQCLKTVAMTVRQFKSLMTNPNCSIRWLLMRTQVIGDAGEGNTALKVEIHTLKTRIKEIFHRKFLWNETKISIDGSLKFGDVDDRSFLLE